MIKYMYNEKVGDPMLKEDLIELVRQIQTIQSETNNVECKSAAQGCPKKLYDTLSSFSNQTGGGTILFGINEENAFSADGVYDAADLQKQIGAQCLQMQPAVRALFTMCEIDGAVIVSAEIPEIDISEKPCYYKGKGRLTGSYIRVGDSDEPMTEYEIYSYEAFRNKYQDDIRIVDRSNISDIDRNEIERYFKTLKEKKSRFSSMSEKDIMHMGGISEDNKLTLAGLLVFSNYPQAFFPRLCITAVSVPGTKLGDTDDDNIRFIDNKRIDGTIPQMLDDALMFVQKNMSVSTKIDSETGKRQDIYDYPPEVIREIIINALVHRDYSVHTEGMPVQIIMYKDRIEVISPGGLYGRIKVDQLGKIQPDTRNPVLATILEDIGTTENRYSGIPTIRRVLRKAGMPEAVFDDKHGSFTVTVYKRRRAGDNGLIGFCSTPRTRSEILAFLGTDSYYAFKNVIDPLVRSGKLLLTLPEKPRSKYQRYVASDEGV